jgi:hypothetical protein
MTNSVFPARPDRIEKKVTFVMAQSTVDDLPHIQLIWPV